MNKLKSLFHENTLISNTLYFTFSSAISKIISVFLIYIYVNYLSVEEYGLFDYFFIIATLINLTFSLEITQGLARYLPSFKGLINKKILLSTSIYLLLFSSIIFLIILFIFKSFVTKYIFNFSIGKFTYNLMSLFFLLNFFHLFFKNNFRWLANGKDFFIQSLIFIVSNSLLLYYFLVIKNYNINGALMANIISSFLAILYCFNKQKIFFGNYFSKKIAKFLLKFTTPLILSSSAVYFATFLDRIFISKFLGYEDLAVYSLGHRFSAALGFIIFGLVSSYAPQIYKHPYSSKVNKLFEDLLKLILLFSFVTYVGLYLFADDLILLMGNQSYQDSSTIILILSVAMIFNYSIILFPGLIIECKTKLIAKINFITGLFNLALNYFVVYFFDSIFYIAFATLLSQIIYFSLNAYYSSKFYTFHRYKFFKFIKSFVFFPLIIFLSILFPSQDFNYLLKIIIFILLVIFMVGLIDKSILKKLIKTISFK